MLITCKKVEFRGLRTGEYEGRPYTSLTFEDEEARQYRMSLANDCKQGLDTLIRGTYYNLNCTCVPYDKQLRIRVQSWAKC